MPLNAEQVHRQKIEEARRSLEDSEGKKIKAEKILEWTLLDISETLRAINFQLCRSNMAGR